MISDGSFVPHRRKMILEGITYTRSKYTYMNVIMCFVAEVV